MNPILTNFSKREMLANVFWLVLALTLLYVSISYLGADNLRAKVESLGIWGPLLLILAKVSTLVFAPLGGAPLYPIAGALFGPVYGFMYVFVGDAIGSTLCFFISRRFGRRIVRYFVTESGMPIVERLLGYLGTNRGFIKVRFFFIGFPEAISYAAGLTKLPYTTFITVSMLMYIVPDALYVWLGSALVSLNPIYAAFYMMPVLLLAFCGAALLYWQTRDMK